MGFDWNQPPGIVSTPNSCVDTWPSHSSCEFQATQYLEQGVTSCTVKKHAGIQVIVVKVSGGDGCVWKRWIRKSNGLYNLYNNIYIYNYHFPPGHWPMAMKWETSMGSPSWVSTLWGRVSHQILLESWLRCQKTSFRRPNPGFPAPLGPRIQLRGIWRSIHHVQVGAVLLHRTSHILGVKPTKFRTIVRLAKGC